MKKNNKKITKIIAPLALASGCLATLPATSCGMHSSVKHIAPYLHEITYDDYTYDKDFITTKDAEAFGCSSVRNGNFYGRNFDYVFNDTPEFIVRVKANKKKNRHESIGVATHFGLRESKLLKGEYKKQLELVPNITLDGINDAGVICSHNVVSMEPDKKDDGTPVTAETQPGKTNKLHQLFIPRYILDNADNVDHAIELLTNENLNIVGNLSGTHHLHVMIAGKDKNGKEKTVVVEFFDNTPTDGKNQFNVVVDEKTGNQQIMTNYYVNNGDNQFFTNNVKNGVERFAILQAGYDSADSFAGMESLMKKVMFSNSYRYLHNIVPWGITMKDGDADVEGTLESEWYSESFKQPEIVQMEGQDISQLAPITEIFNKLKQDYWITRMMDFRNPPEPKFWQTTHNSTYDMEKKHLRVVVQEQYEVYFDYYL